MLIKRSERQARHGKIASALASQSDNNLDRRSCPAPLRSGRRQPGGARQLTACRYTASGGRPAPTLRRNRYSPEEFLHPLLGRLLGYRRSRKRRVDRQEPDYDSPINRGSHCLQRGGSPR